MIDVIVSTREEFDNVYEKMTKGDINLTERLLLAEGWRNKYHADWVLEYRSKYYADLITLSDSLPFAFF